MTVTMKNMVIDKIWSLVKPLAQEEGIEVVDVVWQVGKGRSLMRIVVDKPGGINIDDCRNISKRLNYLLEVEDLSSGPYHLEVTSPGIFCELKKTNDYVRNKGKRVLIQTQSPGQKRQNVSGILEAYDSEHCFIRKESGDRILIDIDHITKARLDPIVFPRGKGKGKVRKGKKWAGK